MTSPAKHTKTTLLLFGKNIAKRMAIVAGVIVGSGLFLTWFARGCSSEVATDGGIAITPVQVAKIRSIGQWEFLSISDEEIVDTIRHGFFGDDELTRIYYGTLRIGIDLGETKEGWIRMDGDTVTAVLPPVKLLDEHFIDEALTKAFYEKGNWNEADKAAMTRRAARMMKARCLTPSNIGSAEQNAALQFANLLHAMGFEFTRVRFSTKVPGK